MIEGSGATTLEGIRLFVALLAVAAVTAIVVRRLRVPYSVALVLLGLAAGAVLPAGAIQVTPELVLLVLVPGLVFEAALRLELKELRQTFGWLVLLAAPGVLVSAAIVAVVLNLATGLIFLIGHPEQYAHNIAWWAKVGFLAAAGVNALAFETLIAGRAMAVADGADTPIGAKTVGLVSLIAWFGVLYWGRMLPFIGGAF